MTVSTGFGWSPYKRLLNKIPPLALQSKTLCPFCRAGGGLELVCTHDLQCFEDRDGQNRFTHRVAFCDSCGMVYTDPWFTREGARWLMERAGASYGYCDPEERVDWVLSMAPEVRSVLDLGCGDGSFLGGFPEGFTLSGFETDEKMVLSGRLKFPHIRFVQQDLENPSIFPQADLITIFHFLEHLSSPLEFLRLLRKETRSTSRLLVEVPVLDRAVETHGPDICGFFSVPHRSHFSRNTLVRMLSEAGWKVDQKLDLQGNGFRVLASPTEQRECVSDRMDLKNEEEMALEYVECRENSIRKVQAVVDLLPENGNFLIWGGGHHTEFLGRLTSLFSGKRLFLIVDNDPVKSGSFIHGIPIVEPSALNPEQWQSGDLKVIISSYSWQESIFKDLVKLGVNPSQIIQLYS
ncbi:MAG: class I SAM-dependent methyltransferase [Candidatus Nitronauta litoralis]|uniref:Class I SAM-dependent methyltransferase n=1 Tax=Candidatus Nitronauta litoralis TaxID=2705533 RepID=A0A7T0BZ57_9BACT|nr:MAG: class I SAM-dependent methyltransferase [Candidatus Nitronauta litoralis]